MSFAIKAILLHPVGLLFPRITVDAQSNSHQALSLSIACTIDTIACLRLSWQYFLCNGMCATQMGLNGALFASQWK
jgi:hypothetical protein